MYQSFDFSEAASLSSAQGAGAAIRGAKSRETFRLFGLDLYAGERDQVARMLVRRAVADVKTRVSFINAHCVNVAAKDDHYRSILKESHFLLPDGSGLRIAAKLARQRYGDNLNGTDLFPLICEYAAQAGASLFLLGGEPGVADAAAAEMQRRYPGLKVAGTQHGYFDRANNAQVIDQINASKADMLFVGFGVPLQEKWVAENSARLAAPVTLAVGGLFDYYSGRIPRAPAAFRKAGCEWVWRLAQEPRRLAERYLLGNAIFLLRALLNGLNARTGFGINALAKRLIDVVATGLGLVALAPVFLAIALAIKLEDGGPVLFSQTRIGKDGKPFRMFKFRSMVMDAEKRRAALASQSDRDSVCFKMRRDPRITRVGSLLRRTSLDELPQLFNVFGGTMSLVGPRPALPQEVTAYSSRAFKRLSAKPGITCTWQVSGRAEIPFERQVEMDIDYVERPSLLRDFVLLARTLPAVLSARGAY